MMSRFPFLFLQDVDKRKREFRSFVRLVVSLVDDVVVRLGPWSWRSGSVGTVQVSRLCVLVVHVGRSRGYIQFNVAPTLGASVLDILNYSRPWGLRPRQELSDVSSCM